MKTDPYYSAIKADTGTVVTGMAAFIVRTKRAGGPTNMFREVGAIAAQEMFERMEAAAKRPKLRLVKTA
ncbi:hypothetical protein [Duganella sp. HH105]|jgi:hypothetical protein|uniref:hypothetical protein n=1 Tax=Duganella sp. HH105 TaxID=1781067 RepID=UPI000877BF88|nr:hypothetical protein [Duganella sp. HH105]OEZ61247.1 hypothetical protein DUGA6_22730 [Duganella sp. HH105]